MLKIQPVEEADRIRVISCLEAFLNGKQHLNWIKGVIGKSGVLQRKGELHKIFNELRFYDNLYRYQEILKECQKEGWV